MIASSWMTWWGLLSCASGLVIVGDVPPEPSPELVTERWTVDEGTSIDFVLPADAVAANVEIHIPRVEGVPLFATRLLDAPAGHGDLPPASRLGTAVSWRLPDSGSDAEAPLTGAWSIETNDLPGRRSIVLQHRPALDGRGRLTVQVVLTRRFADDPQVREVLDEALERLADLWDGFGIEIVSYVQQANAPSRCPSHDDARDRERYQLLVDAGADHDVTMIVCSEIAERSHAVLGASLSGALTGHPYAVNFVEFSYSALEMSRTIGHELGHAGGLAHPEIDDLTDTPDCDGPETCDQANLMFSAWREPDCEPDEDERCEVMSQLTAQQQEILRSWTGVLPL